MGSLIHLLYSDNYTSLIVRIFICVYVYQLNIFLNICNINYEWQILELLTRMLKIILSKHSLYTTIDVYNLLSMHYV